MGEDDIIIQENKHFEKMQFRLKVATNFLYILVPLSLWWIGLILFLLIANRVQNSETTWRLLVIYWWLTAMAMAGILPIIIIFILIQSYYIHKIEKTHIETASISWSKTIRILWFISLFLALGTFAFSIILVQYNRAEQTRLEIERNAQSIKDSQLQYLETKIQEEEQQKQEEMEYTERYNYLLDIFSKPISIEETKFIEWKMGENTSLYEQRPNDLPPYDSIWWLNIKWVDKANTNYNISIILGKSPERTKTQIEEGEKDQMEKNMRDRWWFITVQMPSKEHFLKTYSKSWDEESFMALVIAQDNTPINNYFQSLLYVNTSIKELVPGITKWYNSRYRQVIEFLSKGYEYRWPYASKELEQYDKFVQFFEEPQTILGASSYTWNGSEWELSIKIKNEQWEEQTIFFFGESLKIQKIENYINDNLLDKKANIVLIDEERFKDLLTNPILSNKKITIKLGALLNGESHTFPKIESIELYVPTKIYTDGELLNDRF